LSQYFEVYRLHTAHISEETAARRRKNVEDVQKRAAYRKAHGLDGGDKLGGWTAKEPGEELGPALIADVGLNKAVGGPVDPSHVLEGTPALVNEQVGCDPVVDSKKKPLKKWLGIW
jgi:hypothetical protein